jgi:type I restriction enzyme S subunit
MGSEWTELPLEEAMDAIIDYRGKTPKKTDSGIPLITAKIVKNGRIQPTQEYIAEEDYDSWMQRGLPQKGDVVLTTEAPLGEVAQLDGSKVALAQRIITLRGKSGLLESDFLKYLLQSHAVQHQFDGRASGTTVSGIKQSELRQVLLSFPPLPEQKAIAHILGTLDDKIELNRRMNATLEGMAQALFKSWFVDFDPVIDNALAAGNPIPDELAPRAEVRKKALANGTTQQGSADHPTLSDPKSLFPAAFEFTEELGWIPEGWEVVKLQNVCERIFSGGTPRTKEPDFWNGGIPWLSSGETGQRFILDTEKTITQAGVENSSTRQTRKGAVVIASAGQGKTRGQTSNLCFDSYINQSVIALEADNSVIPDSFLFFDLARRYEEFRQISDAHSSRGSLTTKLLAEIAVVVPTGQPLSDFGTIAGDAIRKITANARQTSELSKLRDTLLPKLIAGELPTSNS